MLKCKEVKKVWRELNLETVRCTLSDAQTAREMVEAVLKLKSNEHATVIMLLYLWGVREIVGGKKEEEGQ